MAILAALALFVVLVIAGLFAFVRDIAKALEIFDEQADWDY